LLLVQGVYAPSSGVTSLSDAACPSHVKLTPDLSPPLLSNNSQPHDNTPAAPPDPLSWGSEFKELRKVLCIFSFSRGLFFFLVYETIPFLSFDSTPLSSVRPTSLFPLSRVPLSHCPSQEPFVGPLLLFALLSRAVVPLKTFFFRARFIGYALRAPSPTFPDV